MKASDTVRFRDDPRSLIVRLRALIQRSRSPDVIDFELIKAIRARTLPGAKLIVTDRAAAGSLMRALGWAEAAQEAGRASAYRRAARRVRDIYLRECRHPSLIMLSRTLSERANELKRTQRDA